MIRIHNRKL